MVDVRCSNTRLVKEAVEQHRGSKVFVKHLERSHMSNLTTADSHVASSKPEILPEVEDFYGQLYALQSLSVAPVPRDPLLL